MNSALSWILRLVPALILAQTLPFKLGGHPESKALFTTLTEKALGDGDLEALARLGTGGVELVAVILLVIPKFSRAGSILTIALMAGALASHVLFLGFAGSNGQLAALAAVALIISGIYLVWNPRGTPRSPSA